MVLRMHRATVMGPTRGTYNLAGSGASSVKFGIEEKFITTQSGFRSQFRIFANECLGRSVMRMSDKDKAAVLLMSDS